MTKKIGFIIDPLESLNPKKDTSLYLMQAAIDRGYTVFIATTDDLFINNGIAYASVTSVTNADERLTGASQTIPLATLNIIIMRKDPPFNMHYIYATYILELAEQAGTLVLNKPRSIRDCNEKIFITQFPDCIAETLVSNNSQLLAEFLEQHQDIVIKTLDSMGGDGVSRMKHAEFSSSDAIQSHLNHLISESGYLMAQQFLPAVYAGDKRIILFDGEPLPYAVVRLPKENEFRANLAQGGHYKIEPLSERDIWLCNQIKSELKTRGLFFVGLDVIGDYITEINVTSPTCLRELANGSEINPADCFFNHLIISD